MKVILASTSPRRKELLKEIFSDFEILSPNCEEKVSKSPIKTVLSVALSKAECIDEDYDILISADTIVVYKNKIIGKPIDELDAKNILSRLQGKTHKVYTGVCIKYKSNGIIFTKTFYDCSKVKMKKMSCDDISRYVETGSPLDKAGAYGIQDGVVKKHFGSYTNIVGLPVEKIKKELTKLGLI